MVASLTGMILADNGARVVKIEPPTGDRLRDQHPSAFAVWNRGKESLVADLRTAPGAARLRELAGGADILVDGLSPGVLTRWGAGYDDLAESNPALVYGSVAAFASDGPLTHLKAYEGVVAAKSGIFSPGAAGYRPGPIYVNAPLASFGAGLMLTSGILAALIARAATGRGQRVESSLWQGLNPYDYCGTVSYQHALRSDGDVELEAGFVRASRYVLMGCSRDGKWFSIQTMFPRQAQALARALDLAPVLDDKRFARVPQFANADDAEAWEQLLWERMRDHDGDVLMKRFLAEPDLPFEIAGTTEDAMHHPQVLHNGGVIALDDPRWGPIRQVGPVAELRETPSVIRRPAPALGQADRLLVPGDRPGPAPASEPSLAHPLDGVTIVECGYFYSMPNAVAMAAALGARVVKLEDEQGDPMRWFYGAPESGAAKAMEGKESLSVDLKSPDGQRIAHELIAGADVFIVSFRPGVAERLHLGYEELRRLNPKLIFIDASGYGRDGPWASRPMYAVAATALAGSYHRHAGYWLKAEINDGFDVPELRAVLAPRISSRPEGDANGSLLNLTAILLALTARTRHGISQFVTTNLANANIYSLADDFTQFEGKQPIALSDPEFFGTHALYRLYQAKTGWIFLAAPNPSEWIAVLDEIGHPELAEDPRFSSPSARTAHDKELIEILQEVVATRPAATWERDLSSRDVGCAEVFEGSASEFTATDSRLRESGLTFEIDDPTFGRVIRHGLPVKLSDTPGRVAPPCLTGQHTDTILSSIGYRPDQIAALRARRVVFGGGYRAITNDAS